MVMTISASATADGISDVGSTPSLAADVTDDAMPRLHQIRGHRAAHIAKANEGDRAQIKPLPTRIALDRERRRPMAPVPRSTV